MLSIIMNLTGSGPYVSAFGALRALFADLSLLHVS